MRERRQELVLHFAQAFRRRARGALALEQGGPLGGGALRRLVEACVVDGDAGLRGNAGDEALGPLGEHAGLRVPEEQSADDLARPGLDGHGEIAAYRQVPLRHAVMRRHGPVARIGEHVVQADGQLAAERRAEQRGRARVAEVGEGLARCTRQGVEQEGVAVLVGDVVEERAELRAAQLGRRVGDRLHEGLQVELRGEQLAGLVEDLEDAALLVQRRLGVLALRDVLDDADETIRLAGRIPHQRDRRQAPDLAAALAEIPLLERVFRDFSGKQLANRRFGHGTVVRVRELAEGHLVELCLGVPENLAEAPVEVDEMAVERGQGDADGRLVEDGAKLLVTREQRVGASEGLRIQRRHYLEAPGSRIAGGRICGLLTKRCRGGRTRRPRPAGSERLY